MVDDAEVVAVVPVLPDHPPIEWRGPAGNAGLRVPRDHPAVYVAAGVPRIALDRRDITESNALVGRKQGAVVATPADVDPAPCDGRVVDVMAVALLGRGIAVVQIAGTRVVAAGVCRALVLHLGGNGLYGDLVVRRQQRSARSPAAAAGGHRARQRTVEGADLDLAVLDVLRVDVPAAPAMEDEVAVRRGHDLV